jgi:hypothetical protein
MDAEQIRQQKSETISKLLVEKKVDTIDDYYNDIFVKEGTTKMLFSACSARFYRGKPNLMDKTLDIIIEKLTAYEPED